MLKLMIFYLTKLGPSLAQKRKKFKGISLDKDWPAWNLSALKGLIINNLPYKQKYQLCYVDVCACVCAVAKTVFSWSILNWNGWSMQIIACSPLNMRKLYSSD